MANHVKGEAIKTYKTEKNTIKGIRTVYPNLDEMDVRFYTAWSEEGRCFPVFVGIKAFDYGIQFNFNIVA